MNFTRTMRLVLAAAAIAFAPLARADLITLDLCPAGTTSNLNIYGTTLSVGVADWSGASYREYQFQLSSSGSATFDAFSVLLSGQLRNNTVAYGNTLRASIWSGTIAGTPNPLLADALTTISVSNSLMTASGYSPKIELTGPSFPTAQSITSTPSIFFFRVWAEGTINDGYQTKMASTKYEIPEVTMSPNNTIDGGIGVDTDGNGSLDLVDPMAEVVPEIDPAGLGSVLALVTGLFGLIERRRAA